MLLFKPGAVGSLRYEEAHVRMAMFLAAAAVCVPAAAAQRVPARPEPPRTSTGDEIYSPGIRIRSTPPSEEALELGRRLALALDHRAILGRVRELLAKAEAQDHAPGARRAPDGPIRAVGQLESPVYGPWGIELQARAVEHASMVYARRYPIEDMKQLVAFLESPVGAKFVQDRAASAEVGTALSDPQLEEDLWEVVCGLRPTGPGGTHHGLRRLHPRVDGGPAPRPPVWCFAPVPAARE
jgi:hypothetical protein